MINKILGTILTISSSMALASLPLNQEACLESALASYGKALDQAAQVYEAQSAKCVRFSSVDVVNACAQDALEQWNAAQQTAQVEHTANAKACL